jgi:hypothetical protein
MPHLEEKLNDWIEYRFLGEMMKHKFPIWLDNSKILSDEIINAVNNFFPFRINALYAHKIFSGLENGMNFPELAARLKLANGWFMLILKIKNQESES